MAPNRLNGLRFTKEKSAVNSYGGTRYSPTAELFVLSLEPEAPVPLVPMTLDRDIKFDPVVVVVGFPEFRRS